MNRRKEIQANLSACDLTEDRRALYFSPQIKSQGHGTFSFMLEIVSMGFCLKGLQWCRGRALNQKEEVTLVLLMGSSVLVVSICVFIT